jgi:hypothetical protein
MTWRTLLRPVCAVLGHRRRPVEGSGDAMHWRGWQCTRCDWCRLALVVVTDDGEALARLLHAAERAEAKHPGSVSYRVIDVPEPEEPSC